MFQSLWQLDLTQDNVLDGANNQQSESHPTSSGHMNFKLKLSSQSTAACSDSPSAWCLQRKLPITSQITMHKLLLSFVSDVVTRSKPLHFNILMS